MVGVSHVPGNELPGHSDVTRPSKRHLTSRLRRGPASLSARADELRRGFTLVEMLVAVGLTVMMMTMVVTVFGLVMDSIRNSRGSIEINDRLRAAKNRLQLDLGGITAPMTPPLDPAKGLGFFEYIEGPIGPVVSYAEAAASDTPDDVNGGFLRDSTAGDLDDLLMFTTVSSDEPFVGRLPVFTYDAGNITDITSIQVRSNFAEVAWFVRGTTLYRRVLLIYTPPNNMQWPTVAQLAGKNLYNYCDISLRLEGTPDFSVDPPTFDNVRYVPNTLGDLTKRENRYAHQPFAWPYDARFWGGLGLPTLEECTGSDGITAGNRAALDYASMTFQETPSDIFTTPRRRIFLPRMNNGNPFATYPSQPNPYVVERVNLTGTLVDTRGFDPWRVPHPAIEQDQVTGQFVGTGTRVGEDVILTNVIGFDVKVWDPGAPIITLNDTSNPANINGEAIMPSDPPAPVPDEADSDTTTTTPMIRYALTRLLNNTGASDGDKIVGFGAFVDLNYMCRLGNYGNVLIPNYNANDTVDMTKPTAIRTLMIPAPLQIPEPQFHHPGDSRSGFWGTLPQTVLAKDVTLFPYLLPSIYDTFSTHYESDGIRQRSAGVIDAGINGIDDNGNGAVDEKSAWPDLSGENETAPPYPHPIRGMQIKIRVFEPDTRQVREVTIEHEFLPQ